MLHNKGHYKAKQTTQDRTENRMSYSTMGSTSGKVVAIANELGYRKTQLKCYNDILLTGNWY